MRKIVLIVILIGTISVSIILVNTFKKEFIKKVSELDTTIELLEKEVNEVNELVARSSAYSSEIGFFINMKISSRKNRFFVCNLKSRRIVDKGLVAHGAGSETGIEGKLEFSNEENSFCTSLGKYRIGNSYNGSFGKAYKLYGLEETNSNSMLRNIVLHKYYRVPYEEQKDVICNSLGCPMVNEIFYRRLETIIDNSEKSILLSIYY